MADTIMQIIQWAIPSGGVGAAIAWIANRKVKEASAAKSVHDTYKAMYEDVSRLLMETQGKYEENTKLTEKLVAENNLTRRAVNRLSRAIEAIQLCPHRAACPVSGELSLSEDGDEGKPARGLRGGKGQHRQRKEREDAAVDGAGEGGHCADGDSSGLDAVASAGRGFLDGGKRPGEGAGEREAEPGRRCADAADRERL